MRVTNVGNVAGTEFTLPGNLPSLGRVGRFAAGEGHRMPGSVPYRTSNRPSPRCARPSQWEGEVEAERIPAQLGSYPIHRHSRRSHLWNDLPAWLWKSRPQFGIVTCQGILYSAARRRHVATGSTWNRSCLPRVPSASRADRPLLPVQRWGMPSRVRYCRPDSKAAGRRQSGARSG